MNAPNVGPNLRNFSSMGHLLSYQCDQSVQQQWFDPYGPHRSTCVQFSCPQKIKITLQNLKYVMVRRKYRPKPPTHDIAVQYGSIPMAITPPCALFEVDSHIHGGNCTGGEALQRIRGSAHTHSRTLMRLIPFNEHISNARTFDLCCIPR